MAYRVHLLDDVATADLAFDVEGDSLDALFQGATQAVIEILADPQTIGCTWHQVIERSDEDPAALLFDWLSDLVYWKDAAGVVFHDARLPLTCEYGTWKLVGTLWGEPVNHAKQTLHSDVKGITKHLYDVRQEGECWRARVVVDV